MEQTGRDNLHEPAAGCEINVEPHEQGSEGGEQSTQLLHVNTQRVRETIKV